MTYKVVSVVKLGQIQGNYGTLDKYGVMFEGQTTAAEMLQKPESPVVKPGDVLEGELTTDPKYGLKFRRSRSGGFGKNDPQTREEIIRQNSLTNAVNFCVGKANHMQAKDAVDYLTGKQIIQVATYFAKYSQGKVTVVMEPGEIAKEFGYQETEEPVNDGEMGEQEQIEPSDVPF